MNDAAASTVNESPDNAPIQPSAELVLTSVPGPNKALVDRAISELREKLVEAVARAALDVGQFLLELFFGGDPARYLDRKKDGDPSFEALLDDPRLKELGLSRTKLYDCIGVHIQRQVLGTEAVMRLQFSHQVALLRAPDERREELLEEAAEKSLSVRTLRERVGEARREEYGESKGGRPTDLDFEKGLTKLNRAIGLFRPEELNEQALERYEAEVVTAKVQALDRHIDQLTAFRERLSAFVSDDET